MNENDLLLEIPLDCETAILLITHCLQAKGFRVARTFDLQSACASLPDNICPHHGTSPCDCQLVVLLVFEESGPPASLVIHGNMLHSECYLIDNPEVRTLPTLHGLIRSAINKYELFEVFKNPQVSIDVP